MRARLFPVISSFATGFVGGFRYEQSREILIARDESFSDSILLKMIPALTIGFGVALALYDGNFRLNALPEHALSTALGFMLGCYAGARGLNVEPVVGR